MRLETIEFLSTTRGAVNEDRAGCAGAVAWVIDGATDVVDAPLAGEVSDASWFAAGMDAALRAMAAEAPLALHGLPARLAAGLSKAFASAQRRKPAGSAEHPSAAGIILQIHGDRLEYVSLGDCALFCHDGTRFHHIGDDAAKAGDRWVAEAIAIDQKQNPGSTIAEARGRLWAKLGSARARMNMTNGYGIFSLTAPPKALIRTGSLSLTRNSAILLATDGLMRLVDVFARYDAKALFDIAASRGLAFLEAELRALETADAACIRFPRAKIYDDATGLLLRVV